MIDHKMRRSERQASDEAARAVLNAGEYGVLSTMGEDGFPYGVPVNYAFDGEKIYFHCAKNCGHKQDNLKFCGRISFCVVCSNEVKSKEFTEKYESTIVFGTAKKSENKRYGLELLVKKYSPDFIQSGIHNIQKCFDAVDVFEITIAKISCKINR